MKMFFKAMPITSVAPGIPLVETWII